MSVTRQRLSILETWKEATRCISDLEDCQQELKELLKYANPRSIAGIQNAARHIRDAVDTLMSKVPDGL